MRILLLLPALAACVTPQQQAASYNSQILCYGAYAGNNNQKALASAELANRGFRCTQDDVAAGGQQWAARQAQNAEAQRANLGAAAILLAPPAASQPPSVNCVTRPVYGGTATTCQ